MVLTHSEWVRLEHAAERLHDLGDPDAGALIRRLIDEHYATAPAPDAPGARLVAAVDAAAHPRPITRRRPC
jgi:hypothetical protein